MPDPDRQERNYPLPRRLRPSSAEFYQAWFGPSGSDRPTEPEHPHTLRCYLFGCSVPRRIGPGHPSNVRTSYNPETRSGWGRAYPIACSRCGRAVRPWDNDYPMVLP